MWSTWRARPRTSPSATPTPTRPTRLPPRSSGIPGIPAAAADRGREYTRDAAVFTWVRLDRGVRAARRLEGLTHAVPEARGRCRDRARRRRRWRRQPRQKQPRRTGRVLCELDRHRRRASGQLRRRGRQCHGDPGGGDPHKSGRLHGRYRRRRLRSRVPRRRALLRQRPCGDGRRRRAHQPRGEDPAHPGSGGLLRPHRHGRLSARHGHAPERSILGGFRAAGTGPGGRQDHHPGDQHGRPGAADERRPELDLHPA